MLEINSNKHFRGGSSVRNNLLKKIAERIMKGRVLKITIISVFAIAGYQYFHNELDMLLVDSIFQN